MMKKAIVVKAPGTNNDSETCYALESSGADARIVHINELSASPDLLDDAAILVIPGGFSYGDNLGAGKVLSLYLSCRLREEIDRFIGKGKIMLGICNGFQALIKAGFLPGGDGGARVTLAMNNTGVFVCRWCRLRPDRDLFWFKGLPGEVELPVAHAEGRFTASSGGIPEISARRALTYIDNPNGSLYDIAGITNREGNLLGLMPHPERFMHKWQHPAYRSGYSGEAWGKHIYRNIVKNA